MTTWLDTTVTARSSAGAIRPIRGTSGRLGIGLTIVGPPRDEIPDESATVSPVVLIWYSDWEMECCGEPFAVHDIVEWDLTPALDTDWLKDVVGDELASRVTHSHEKHGPGEAGRRRRRGQVLSIRCAYGRHAPAPGGNEDMLYPVAGTAQLISVDRVDGREGRRSELDFNGYLVKLELAHEA